jgi:hypothetical protein
MAICPPGSLFRTPELYPARPRQAGPTVLPFLRSITLAALENAHTPSLLLATKKNLTKSGAFGPFGAEMAGSVEGDLLEIISIMRLTVGADFFITSSANFCFCTTT